MSVPPVVFCAVGRGGKRRIPSQGGRSCVEAVRDCLVEHPIPRGAATWPRVWRGRGSFGEPCRPSRLSVPTGRQTLGAHFTEPCRRGDRPRTIHGQHERSVTSEPGLLKAEIASSRFGSGLPRWLRVPWVIRRSMATKRMACSARLLVARMPRIVMNRK